MRARLTVTSHQSKRLACNIPLSSIQFAHEIPTNVSNQQFEILIYSRMFKAQTASAETRMQATIFCASLLFIGLHFSRVNIGAPKEEVGVVARPPDTMLRSPPQNVGELARAPAGPFPSVLRNGEQLWIVSFTVFDAWHACHSGVRLPSEQRAIRASPIRDASKRLIIG